MWVEYLLFDAFACMLLGVYEGNWKSKWAKTNWEEARVSKKTSITEQTSPPPVHNILMMLCYLNIN